MNELQVTQDLITLAVIRSGIRLATPVILGALGFAMCNRAGVLNFAIEGMMLFGAFSAIVAAFLLGNTYLGVVVAILAGGLIGAIFAAVYLKYKVDLVILALALNLFISEMTVFFLRVVFGAFGSWSDPSIHQLPDIEIPIVNQIPIVGELLSGHNIIVYTSWIATIALFIILFHTKFGRHIRAVGENQSAAETVGIDVARVKIFVLVLSGCLAALGGAFLSVGHLTLFTRDMSNGRGWLAVTAALFGFSHPIGVFFTGLFFGFADAFAVRLQTVTTIPPSLVQFLPNVAALVALILVGARGKIREELARRRFRQRAKQEVPGAAATPAE
ncbi:MAG TPA: ABC transporter permease [Anaerolineae bacterium]|nr:ABC transporter permease [Anaerolineae bacterium]